MLQVTLNGNRSNKEHQQLPVSTQQIVEEARLSIEAGADSIHFHVRDQLGNETLDPAAVHEQVGALKQHLPNIPLGLSTGEWIEPDFSKRLHHINQWETIPDFVSINCHEAQFEKIAEAVLAKGIAWEAGIDSSDAAVKFLLSGVSHTCLRILIEPKIQELSVAMETVENIEKILSKLILTQPVLLHGFDHTCWPLFKLALRKQYYTRIGLEDTLFLPDGRKASNNAELVREAKKLIDQH